MITVTPRVATSTHFEVSGLTGPGSIPTGKAGIEPGSATVGTDVLTTEPRRWVVVAVSVCDRLQQRPAEGVM